jgi:hypothetical protein
MKGGVRVAAAVGSLALLGIGYVAFTRVYARPKAALLDALGKAREASAAYDSALDARKQTLADLQKIGETTLGQRLDVVEHQFRTRLSAALASCGLTEIEVNSGSPGDVRSPAGEARLAGKIGASLRKQVDFQVVRGQARGAGALPDVLRALTAVAAQTWVHRIDGFEIEPLGRERERFTLRVDVSTLYTPTLVPADHAGPAPVVPAENTVLTWGPIASKNVFREPPPDAPPVEHAPVVAANDGGPEPAPVPLYQDWRLTGLAILPRLGCQALVFNTRTSESRALAPGEAVLDAVFEGGLGERAVFRIAEERFEVVNGQSLADRKPIN